jgi:uncharacterized protein YdiU (UPF0061 family)
MMNAESLSEKEYRNEFVNSFDGDQSGDLTPRQTPHVLYSRVLPTPVSKPQLLAWSESLAEELGIRRPTEDQDLPILAGSLVTPSMQPYAACYAGHQFGSWAGQLGDGRAITLGEWVTTSGASFELQLKGAGQTPYSRRADGRAVLRSSLREYLMSEAMHYLGVPTTRALSLVTTGEQVMRDMFYNGHPAFEPGAVVMRVSPGFLRFGNFEMLAARKETDNLRKLTDWTIEKYYPHIQGEDRIITWFREVVEKTTALMVEWLRVGFVHGVMNTDNMSVLGLTIDYGPYSFIDKYDPDFTPNTTDLPGRRYAFGKQPAIAKWNLGCLAGAIVPLLADREKLIEILENYEKIYQEKYYAMMGNKLGLDAFASEDYPLILELEKMLGLVKPDMTIFFQQLGKFIKEGSDRSDYLDYFKDSFYKQPTAKGAQKLNTFLDRYKLRMGKNNCSPETSFKKMSKNNPRFILRNYLLHQAIEDINNGDNTLFAKLQEAIKDPYSDRHDEFFKKRPDWADQKAGCSMLSCSS